MTVAFAQPAPTPCPEPTATVTATPEVPLTFTAGATAGGAAITDPYLCGGGFYGTITGGTAPYSVTYLIANPTNTFTLGSFVTAGPGYASPAGFIDYGAIPSAVYSITVVVTDSASPPHTISLPDFATALITTNCGGRPQAPVAAPHPITTPTPIPVGPSPAAPEPAAAPPSAPPLAHTGAGETTESLVRFSLLMVAVGASALGTRRLRSTRD